jgi:hypothetical protein
MWLAAILMVQLQPAAHQRVHLLLLVLQPPALQQRVLLLVLLGHPHQRNQMVGSYPSPLTLSTSITLMQQCTCPMLLSTKTSHWQR